MKKNKNILVCLIIICVILFTPITESYANSPASIVDLESGLLFDGVAFVPMRGIFEALGAQVTWNREDKSIIATRGDKTVILTVGSTNAIVNGQDQKISMAPRMILGKTYVPVRFVSEIFNAEVKWDSKASQATILMGDTSFKIKVNPANYIKVPVLYGPVVRDKFIVEKDGWIYYSNPNDENHLYKMSSNELIGNKILAEQSYGLNILDDWIYFLLLKPIEERIGMTGSVYRIDSKGERIEKISDDHATQLHVDNDFIYYLRTRPNLVGGIPTIINQKTDEKHVFASARTYGNIIFLPDVSGTYRIIGENVYYDNDISVNTRNMQRNIYSDQYFTDSHQAGDWLYYCNKNGIYKLHLDTGLNIRISEAYTKKIEIKDNYVYFIKSEPNSWNLYGHRLHRVSTDGTQFEKLNDIHTVDFQIINDSIFFLAYRSFIWNYDGEGTNQYEPGSRLFRMTLDGSKSEAIGYVE